MLVVNDSTRLKYRLLDENDIELFFQLDQDPEVMRFINGGEPSSMNELKTVAMPRLKRYHNPQKGWGMWGCFNSDDGEFVGWILIRPMAFFSDEPEFDNLEIGWRLKQKFWGKGLATEAAKQVMIATSEQTGVKQFSANALSENVNSIKIMKKLGMTFVKNYLNLDPLGDQQVDCYSIQLAS